MLFKLRPQISEKQPESGRVLVVMVLRLVGVSELFSAGGPCDWSLAKNMVMVAATL